MTKLNNTVRNPYCLDMITTTFDINPDQQERIANRITVLFRDIKKRTKYLGTQGKITPNNMKRLKTLYYQNHLIVLGTGFSTFTLKLSLQPKSDLVSYLRLEFNPNKAGRIGCQLLRRLLMFLLGRSTAATFPNKCRVTRIDLCFDINLNVGNLFPYYPKTRVSQIMRDEDGMITSFIIGSGAHSPNAVRITIYDKELEQINKNGCSLYNHALFRLEFSVRNTNLSISDLTPSFFLKMIKKLKFYSDDFLEDDYFSNNFLSVADEEGLSAAFSYASENDTKCYKRRLDTLYEEPSPFNFKQLIKRDFRKVLKELFVKS